VSIPSGAVRDSQSRLVGFINAVVTCPPAAKAITKEKAKTKKRSELVIFPK
jgi:hypothetical protein